MRSFNKLSKLRSNFVSIQWGLCSPLNVNMFSAALEAENIGSGYILRNKTII